VITIGDIYISFGNQQKVLEYNSINLWEIGICFKHEKYYINGTFEVSADNSPLRALLGLAKPRMPYVHYKSYCEDLLFSKDDSGDDDATITFDFCIDSTEHDITNRTVISCSVKNTEVLLKEDELRSFFSSIV